MRVLVIGMDGATPQLLFPWAEEGKLPNIAELIEEGVSGNLRSTIPPTTAPAWVSFMTGKRPGNHGVFDFVRRKFGSYETTKFGGRSEIEEKAGIDLSVISEVAIHSKKIWEILSEHGKRVGVMHVPITYPPRKVNGFLISGLGTPSPESEFTYPRELKKKILSMGYKIHITELDVEGNEDAALRDLRETEEKRCEVAIELVEEYNPEFFCIVFESTDFIQHFFWKYCDPEHHAHDPRKAKKYGNAILSCYQLLDRLIGKLIENFDPDTVIIMSDHGGGPLRKIFYINRWLLNQGLLRLREKKTKSIMLNLGLNQDNFKRIITKLGLKPVVKRIPRKIRQKVPEAFTLSDIDWSETKAYSVGGWGFIYLNLKGREPEGTISQEEYDLVRNEIIDKLYRLKDPDTGDSVVKKVYKKEELYGGEMMDLFPDLVIIPEESIDFKHSIPGRDSVLVPAPPEKSGNHRMDGIFIMKGKNVRKNEKIRNAEIIDVAPTVLHVMGVPVPPDMDGKVLDVFS